MQLLQINRDSTLRKAHALKCTSYVFNIAKRQPMPNINVYPDALKMNVLGMYYSRGTDKTIKPNRHLIPLFISCQTEIDHHMSPSICTIHNTQLVPVFK